MYKRRPGCLFALLLFATALFLGYCYLNVTVRDSYSGQWTSASTAAAREKGVLLKEYVVEPRSLRFENYQVEFTDCWQEEVTRTEHDFIFFERVTKQGRPRIVLNYQGQRLSPDPDSLGEAMLVRGEEGSGQDLAQSKYFGNPLELAYHQIVAFPDWENGLNDTIYFSIIRGWSDKRTYQIKAYPRK